MENNWLKKGLNDKLGDYGSPMDLEEAWKALEAQRKPEKKKRRFLGWWFFGLILLVSTSGYFLWNNLNPKPIVDATDLQTTGKKKIQGFSKSKNLNTNDTNDTNDISKNQLTGKVGNIPSSDKVLNNSSSISKTNLPSALEMNSQKNIEANETNSTEIFTNKTTFNSNENVPASTIVNSEVISRLSNDYQSEQQASNQTNEAVPIFSNEISKLPLLPSLSVLLKQSISEILSADLPEIAEVSSPIIKKKRKSVFPHFVGASTGYGFLSKGKVLKGEVPLDVLSVNLFYQRYVGKKLYFKTGINIDQFTNKLESSSTKNYTEWTENQLVEINYYEGSDEPENVYRSADVEVKETTNIELFNKYKFVSVPLLAGVELSSRGRNSFQLEGGISVSILSQYDGNVLVGDSVEPLASLEDLDLKKSGVLNGLYALQWNYLPFKKNTNWEFFLKYQGSFQLNELSNTQEYDLQKFSTQQVFLGLQFHL